MIEIVNKFLLAEDKFIPEMDFILPGFTYSVCGSFTKNKGRIKKLKKSRILTIYLLKWTR